MIFTYLGQFEYFTDHLAAHFGMVSIKKNIPVRENSEVV